MSESRVRQGEAIGAARLAEIVDPHHRHSAGPHPRGQDARDWTRLVVASLARGVLAVMLGLAFWAAAPTVIGWHPTTVMTGSMMPRIHPGDVVVSVPVPPATIQLGKVILFDDPANPGELRLHRYFEKEPHGTLITKGDANGQTDSSPVERSAVRGVGMLRVPWVGLPMLWIHEGRWLNLAILAASVTVLLGLTGIDRDLRHDRQDPARTRRLSTARGRASAERAEEARSAAGAAAVVLLVAGVALSAAPAPSAEAAATIFTGTTTSPASSFTADQAVGVTNVGCTDNSDGTTVTISWSYAGSRDPATFSLINNNTSYGSTTGGNRSAVLSVNSLLGLGLATYAVAVRTDLIAGNTSWVAFSPTVTSVKIVSVLGIGGTSVRCA
jgi:signal peptidase